MSPLWQTAVVALIVLACTVSVLRRLAPRSAWQTQARLSYFLERPGRSGWLRRLGRALRPSVQVTVSACGTGCGTSCRKCD